MRDATVGIRGLRPSVSATEGEGRPAHDFFVVRGGDLLPWFIVLEII